MQKALSSAVKLSAARYAASSFEPAEDAFRKRFMADVSYFVRKGFSVESCFGFVWERTIDEITLSEASQRRLYHEMIGWVKEWAE